MNRTQIYPLPPENGSGFKGSAAEQKVVALEKQINEKSRMIFALDLKIHRAPEAVNTSNLVKEKKQIEEDLDEVVDQYRKKSSNNRFMDFMERMNDKDTNRRNKKNIPQN